MSQLEAAKSESEKYRMEVSRLSAEMALCVQVWPNSNQPRRWNRFQTEG